VTPTRRSRNRRSRWQARLNPKELPWVRTAPAAHPKLRVSKPGARKIAS
jgi:hypothetical protein